MKYSIAILLLCMLTCHTHAQTVVEKHMNYNNQDITLNLQIADSIRIITWDKNEVYTKASIDINNNKSNDLYVTSFTNDNNKLSVEARFDDKKTRAYRDSCNCQCNFQSEIYWEVYVPASAAFSVETINGNIIISGNTKAVKAHSISGFIDLVFDAGRAADLKMSTITGTIYTDLAMGTSKDKHDNTVSTTFNGGGDKVDLETISGDIFLRKQ